MLAEQVRACVSASPHQPSLWRSHTKPRRSPDVASPWEQGRLLRCAAAWRWRRSCDLAVTLEEEVEELMSCWTGEQACARVYCAAPPQAFWRSPGMARWPTKCAGDNNNQQRNRTALSWLDRAIYARAPSLCSAFLLPCQPGTWPHVYLWILRPAEPPCPAPSRRLHARTDPIPSTQSIRVPDQDVDAWRTC